MKLDDASFKNSKLFYKKNKRFINLIKTAVLVGLEFCKNSQNQLDRNMALNIINTVLWLS